MNDPLPEPRVTKRPEKKPEREKDSLEKAIEEEIKRQAKRDEKLKKSGRLLPSNRKFNQMQRPGPNTMQPTGYTREQ